MRQLLTLAACLVSVFIFSQNEKIDQLTVQLAYLDQDSTKVDMSLMLIDELYKIEDYKKASLYINETYKLAAGINYTKGLAKSHYYRALIYTERNDYLNALDNYNRSKHYYQKINDTLGVAKVSNHIGLIEIKRGNYKLGLQNSLYAISVFEQQALKEELSSAYNNLAEAYFKTEQFNKSLDFNFKALNIREQIKDSTAIIVSNMNIAELYSLRKEHRKAIEYYEKVLNLINPESDEDLRGDILPKLGSEYLKFKEYGKASDVLIEGLKYNRKEGNQDGLLRTLNALGNLNLQQKKVKLAELQLKEANDIAQKINNKTALLENYRLHIALDSTRSYFQNAFFWQNKFYNLKETLSKEQELKITEGEVPSDASSEQPEAMTVAYNANIAEAKPNDLWFNKPFVLIGIIALFAILITLLILSFLKLKTFKGTKQNDNTALVKVQNENKILQEEIAQLEEVNEVKDKLFSIVSHDLKDSISSIKAFLDLLKEDSISKDEFYDLIPELSENANNASSLLFNLLNWSKSQMQNLEPKPELFNIQEVFHTKIALVEQKVEDKRIVLIDESQEDFIYADKSMIEIVIQNLITNAVKFSRTGDVITVSNQEANGKALICIEDTGVGIPRENIDKLFSAHKNFTTVGTKNEKGTGLGLTIAKDLIELNKGRIWVESTQNVGSKFFIELPKTAKQV